MLWVVWPTSHPLREELVIKANVNYNKGTNMRCRIGQLFINWSAKTSQGKALTVSCTQWTPWISPLMESGITQSMINKKLTPCVLWMTRITKGKKVKTETITESSSSTSSKNWIPLWRKMLRQQSLWLQEKKKVNTKIWHVQSALLKAWNTSHESQTSQD
jgi:hypothetical protein